MSGKKSSDREIFMQIIIASDGESVCGVVNNDKNRKNFNYSGSFLKIICIDFTINVTPQTFMD